MTAAKSISPATHQMLVWRAVEAERAACALIARQQGCSDPDCQECVGGNIAAKIRER